MLVLTAGWVMVSNPSVCLAEAAVQVKDFAPPKPFALKEMDLENIEERMYFRVGIVDAVTNKALVIGDIQYNFAPDFRIRCHVGSYVGIKVNKKGQVIACEPVRQR